MKVPKWTRKARTFASVLYRKERWALVLSCALLAGAIAVGSLYWQRFSAYENVMLGTLSADMMPTPQSRKGLEAFLMSGLPMGIEEALSTSTLNPEVIKNLRKLSDDVANETPDATLTLRLFHGTGGLVFTDDQQPGFLFLPSMIIRPTLSPQQVEVLQASPEGVAPPPFVTDAVLADPEMVRDIHFTAAFIPALDNLSRTSITGNLNHIPIQAYVITKNGINRIFNGDSARRTVYQELPETTFFPSRPYFWQTFDGKSETEQRYSKSIVGLIPRPNARVADYFAISKPYMDLAGSGLVVTLTRGLWVAGLPRAAVCFDVRLQPTGSATLESLLRRRIQQLGGISVIVQCNTDGKDISCTPTGASGTDDDRLAGDMRLTLLEQGQKQQRAEIVGNIHVSESDQHHGTLKGSVPLGPATASTDQPKRFLVFEVDLTRYHRLTILMGLTAATLFGCMTLVLAYLWGAETKHDEELHQAFERVASVMHASATPYVLIGPDGLVVDFTTAFLDLLKIAPAEAYRVKEQKFESYIADDDSRKEYNKAVEGRRAGEPISPYELRLSISGQPPVMVKVFSAVIPSRDDGSLPGTFAFLIPKQPDTNSESFQRD